MSDSTQTAAILNAISAYMRRYVMCSGEQLTALTLWVAHTYVYDRYDTTPYLIITSAEKGSGKTRVLESVAPLVLRPDTLAAVTEAALFRIVSEEKPTMLLDEVDTIFKDSTRGMSERQEGLRAILNAGYRRGTRVPRVMPGGEIARFEVYGPKAFAAIGSLPETIEHRGLRIRMERKATDAPVEKLRFRKAWDSAAELRMDLQKWADNANGALLPEPPMPDELDDRAQDAYEVLVAIADAGGSEWSSRGRAALIALRGQAHQTRESMGIRLLRDINLSRHKFENLEHIPTADLLGYLYADGEEPWSDWWRGKDGESYGKKASMGLSKILREFGIVPSQVQVDGERSRGYYVGPLIDVLGRYMGEKVEQSSNALQIPGNEVEHSASGYSTSESPQTSMDTGESSTTRPFDQGKPEKGSTKWIGQASMEELREFYGE